MNKQIQNIDLKVVEDFGEEWTEYNYEFQDKITLNEAFEQYFHIFPFEKINDQSFGFDMGCGSGRWAKLIAPRVGKLFCIDPSDKAITIAKRNTATFSNCEYINASVSEAEFKIKNESLDFGYCLGVLHHIPNTEDGIKCCARLLKSGAPFLIYLYYRFDNKPLWYQLIWKVTDLLRFIISPLPFKLKLLVTKLIALLAYYPLAKISKFLSYLNFSVEYIPLSYYRNKNFYVMKTDSLDRFGTKLEKRFTKVEIEKMLINCEFKNISFSESEPYWVAVAYKK